MIRLRQVKILVEQDSENTRKHKVSKLLRCNMEDIQKVMIRKQSIDARHKDQIFFVYELDVEVDQESKILKKTHSKDIFPTPDEHYHLPKRGSKKLVYRPVVVGSGPAGLFAAYLLAEMGYQPIIVERGEKMAERKKMVESFWQTGKLNPESNVQFGEGGAGTFSDGKLNTLTKDKEGRGRKVFETFVKHGAPSDILYLQKPHIGTDLLSQVIVRMREEIITMGGEFRYQTCLTDLIIEDGKLVAIECNHEETFPCTHLILAMGHSARDTFEMLYHHNLEMHAKPFAIGVRVEHPQKLINHVQYGPKYESLLPPADYKLTYTTTKGRGVYSFCMCPEGFVVNASSEEGHLAINGMSNHDRGEKNANSALVVTLNTKDFGDQPLDGMHYQQTLEHLAYERGQGKIPVQLYKDFQKNRASTSFGEVDPIFKGHYHFDNLKEWMPREITEALEEALPVFGRKIPGFDQEDMIMAGIESRTSSPVRISRNEHMESSILGIYPCGEGAGYAGGITTAAIDGLKVAESLIENYDVPENLS